MSQAIILAGWWVCQLIGTQALVTIQHSGPHVCDAAHPDYNTGECEHTAIGMTQASLRERVLADVRQPPSVAKFSRRSQCRKHVKVFSISEMEKEFPDLARCWLSTYAGQLQDAMQFADCRVEDIHKADAVYMPAYLAEECNWPHYGRGSCNRNTFRAGVKCRAEGLEAASLLRERHGLPVVIVDMLPSTRHDIHGHEARQVWARLNLLTSMSIDRHTISQPPPPTPWCQQCYTSRAAQCYGLAMEKKKYNITFKGALRRSHVRRVLAEKYHNPSEGVVIADNANSTYEFEDLLFNSMFSVVAVSLKKKSYRFTEAVCSGGVPVLVTDNWVPPFDRSMPFASYGIKIMESTARNGGLLAELGEYKTEALEKLRANARSVCESSLGTLALQAKQMTSEVLSML